MRCKSRGNLVFMVFCIGLGFIWLVVLPRVARWEPVEARRQFLESKGIDPAAMFYTDIEAMGDIQRRVREKLESR